MPDQRRPDILADLSAADRRRRERQDADYIAKAPIERLGDAEAIAARHVFAGNKGLTAEGMRPIGAGERVDVVVCARVDLDHPIYFADNLFADCTDCGCRLQYRPHAAEGPRLCICCTARRLREEHGNA
jgi:hypothetical protein